VLVYRSPTLVMTFASPYRNAEVIAKSAAIINY
jgi:hypothetical protein